MKIYTVVASWCSDVWIMRSYVSELDAFKFSKACTDHDNSWTMETNKSKENKEEWHRSHPGAASHNATIMYGCDYDVEEHELIGVNTVELNADGIPRRISVTDSSGHEVLRIRNPSDDTVQLAVAMQGGDE